MAKRNDDGLSKHSGSPYWQIKKEYAGRRLRISSRTTDRREAQAQIDTWVEGIKKELTLERLGEQPKARVGEMTIAAALMRYYDEIGRTVATGDNILFNLEWIADNINPNGAGKNTKLSAITEPMLLELAARRRAAGSMRAGIKGFHPLSEGTINRYTYEIVRCVLRRAAISWKAPAAVIDWKALRAPEPRHGLAQRELTLEKERELFARLRIDIREAVDYLLAVGTRRRGALELEWGHVDFDAGMFKVRRKTRQKGGEYWQEIPMTTRVRELLLAQRGRHPRFVWTFVVHRRHCVGKQGFRVGDRKPLTAGVLYDQLKATFVDIGLPHMRIHDLRHTKARRTLRVTKDIAVVRKILGHSDIATTLIYADVLTDDVRVAMEAADDAYDCRKTVGVKTAETAEAIETDKKNAAS